MGERVMYALFGYTKSVPASPRWLCACYFGTTLLGFRRVALRLLISRPDEIREDLARSVALRQLGYRDPKVRKMASRTLQAANDPSVIAVLFEVRATAELIYRGNKIQSYLLGHFDPLCDYLDAAFAAEVLGHIGDTSAVPVLKAAYDGVHSSGEADWTEMIERYRRDSAAGRVDRDAASRHHAAVSLKLATMDALERLGFPASE